MNYPCQLTFFSARFQIDYEAPPENQKSD